MASARWGLPPCRNPLNANYIVLVGDVGTGKSTLVEKLTGERGRSSSSSGSFTMTSQSFWVPDGSLIVADTPGCNPRREKLEHNLWIAHALNFMPVSRIFIVVNAETRLDSMVSSIQLHSDRFAILPNDVVAVLVTHMDNDRKWSSKECAEAIKEDLGIRDVVFSALWATRSALLHDVNAVCNKKYNLRVNDDNFLKLFKIHDNNNPNIRKILVDTDQEVQEFQILKNCFDYLRKEYDAKDQVDLIFEFQAWMEDQIIEAQKRISAQNNFTFVGEKAENEAGHIANMTNQLGLILHEIRLEALNNHSAHHGVSELRKCPHCGIVWAKVEGCAGSTTCGNRPAMQNDLRDASYGVMATFTFNWRFGQRNSFGVKKSGIKKVQARKASSSTKDPLGCGKSINWMLMQNVPVPPEFLEGKIGTEDIKVIPKRAANFKAELKYKLQKGSEEMTIK